MRRFAMMLTIAALAAGLAACGASATASPSATTAASQPAAPASAASAAAGGSAAAGACSVAPAGSTAAVTITIKDFKYSPSPAQAKVGDVVAWTNGDSAPHSATMDDGSCDTDNIAAGATGMLVFTAPGTYTYHCKVHPAQMKDVTIQVQ